MNLKVGGTSNSLYPSESSSVGPNETVTIVWQEGNWYYVECCLSFCLVHCHL